MIKHIAKLLVISRPLFDTLEPLCALYKRFQAENQEQILKDWLIICLSDFVNTLPDGTIQEYGHALRFLYSYRGSFETFNAYRREIDRLLQWSWFVHQKPFLTLKRFDIEAFIYAFQGLQQANTGHPKCLISFGITTTIGGSKPLEKETKCGI